MKQESDNGHASVRDHAMWARSCDVGEITRCGLDHAMWAPRHITTTTCKRQPVHGLISRFFKIIYFINCLNFIIIFNYLTLRTAKVDESARGIRANSAQADLLPILLWRVLQNHCRCHVKYFAPLNSSSLGHVGKIIN